MQSDRMSGSFFGPSNFVDLLRHRAALRPNDRIFTFLADGESEEIHLTYGQLDSDARSIAGRLTEAGLAGERAMLLYPAGLDFISALFGCFYAGVVAVPLPWPLRQRSLPRVEAIAGDTGASAVLTIAASLAGNSPCIDQVTSLSGLRWLATDELAQNGTASYEPDRIGGHGLALLQYTSGSSGAPKGVMLSHANLMHNSALINHCFEHTRSGTGVFWLPGFHDMGLVGGVLQPVYVGRPNVLMSPIAVLQKPVRWLRAITRYRGTSSGAPNFAYDLCVRKIPPEQRSGLDLGSWDVAFTGAEPVRPATIERFVEAFADCGFRREAFYPGYGLAEATLMVSGGYKLNPPAIRRFNSSALESHQVLVASANEEHVTSLVGCGQCMPDQRIVIVDPRTCLPLPEDRVGEIWVSGPSVATGYWQRPGDTAETFGARLADNEHDGPFLRTGDLGFMLDGELFFTGRLHDLIVIRGRNHYPQDIELIATESHPSLRPDCASAFMIDQDGREKLAIVLELEHRRQRQFAEVIDAIRRAVLDGHGLMVEAIALVKAGSIPRTSSGKVQRHLCQQGLLDGTLGALTHWRAPAGSVTEPDTPDAVAVASEAPAGAGAHDRSENTQSCISNAPPVPQPLAVSALVRLDRKQIAQIVVDQVRRAAPGIGVEPAGDASLIDLGLDSLQRFDLLVAIEKALGGRFPPQALGGLMTLNDVVEAAASGLLAADPRPWRAGAVTPADHCFNQFPEYAQLKQSLQQLDDLGSADAFLQVHEPCGGATTVVRGKHLVNFSSYNYLGMADDPAVTQAAKAAVDKYGTSVSASRLVAGERALHGELEAAIAHFVGAESAIVFVGGHATNETTLGHLFGPGDLIVHDALAHNSIIQGCLLSGAQRRAFPHNQWQVLDSLLAESRRSYRRVLIVVEGVYSMDGDWPDLERLVQIKRRHKALLMVDEAHSLGVLGASGRGLAEHLAVKPAEVDLSMGTLSKALGSCGGYIAGSGAVVEYLKYTAPGFVYSVGISPPNAAAALASIELLDSHPERVARLARRADLFRTLAAERRLDIGQGRDSAIVPVIVGNSKRCVRLSRALFDAGISVQPIVCPAVSENAARLRFFITTHHSEEHIRAAVDATADALATIDPAYLKKTQQRHAIPVKA